MEGNDSGTIERMVEVTYRMTLDMPADAEPNDIPAHPEVTAPPRAEIFDWKFEGT